MRNLRTIKIEGGMPRDERRETIRALRHCPLEKIVLNGVCCPLGNTWGENGQDISEPIDGHDPDFLEAEDMTAIFDTGHQPPTTLPQRRLSCLLNHFMVGKARRLCCIQLRPTTLLRSER